MASLNFGKSHSKNKTDNIQHLQCYFNTIIALVAELTIMANRLQPTMGYLTDQTKQIYNNLSMGIPQ